MTFDLETLRLIGWALLGFAMLGLALYEGLSMGVMLLLPVLGVKDEDRQALLNSIAPTSMANLAWLVIMVAIVFAAWPIVYAVTMASFYPLLILVLLALILRPLALFFLDAFEDQRWRQYGYKALVASGLLPAVLLGLLVGNLLKGIPFHLDSDMRIVFLGDFPGLFNLFSILVAATCLALLAMHASVFLQLRTLAELRSQAQAMTIRAGVAFIILFAASGLWITHLEGYHITSDILPNDPSNPLAKFVKRSEGLWLDNYEHLPVLWAIPVLAFIGGLAAMLLAKWERTYWAMIASSSCVAMVVLTFGISMFPFLLPSNISLNSSLTLWDSSASQLTLQTLLGVAVFALPFIAICSRWGFRLFADRVEWGKGVR